MPEKVPVQQAVFLICSARKRTLPELCQFLCGKLHSCSARIRHCALHPCESKRRVDIIDKHAFRAKGVFPERHDRISGRDHHRCFHQFARANRLPVRKKRCRPADLCRTGADAHFRRSRDHALVKRFRKRQDRGKLHKARHIKRRVSERRIQNRITSHVHKHGRNHWCIHFELLRSRTRYRQQRCKRHDRIKQPFHLSSPQFHYYSMSEIEGIMQSLSERNGSDPYLDQSRIVRSYSVLRRAAVSVRSFAFPACDPHIQGRRSRGSKRP